MKNELFHFKQFSVQHNNQGLKVNTDAALLGALAGRSHPKSILDIGTGTGVIALMLAQRFLDAKIDAVESNISIADNASANFSASVFAERLKVFPLSFQRYFYVNADIKYDLIVSNPPFFLHALKPQNDGLKKAKHGEQAFFDELFLQVKNHLNQSGEFWLILPPQSFQQLKDVVSQNGWHEAHFIHVFSSPDKPEFRTIINLKKEPVKAVHQVFQIRRIDGSYAEAYIAALQDFLTIF